MIKKRIVYINLLILGIVLLFSMSVLAADEIQTNETQKFEIGQLVNAGNRDGYSEKNKIEKGDYHYGWKLGRFYIGGFTSHLGEANEEPIFLKNTGDKVSLWFTVEQDINKLDGNDDYSICEDKKGYDEAFQTKTTNFGKGALIVGHKNSQGSSSEPQIYTDYVKAVKKGANTSIQLFEEGDYEVALDYRIKNENINLFGWDVNAGYSDYRISFKFKVRNSNCMIFFKDVKTEEELTNKAITENGFRLDYANSKYLDVSVKKDILNDRGDGLVEDTRFNRQAKDKEEFTDEGLYTITVKNKYTSNTTIKVIAVGKNTILQTHAKTGKPVSEIISNDKNKIDNRNANNEGKEEKSIEEIIILCLMGVVIVLLVIMFVIKRNNYKNRRDSTEKQKKAYTDKSNEEVE